MILKQTKTALFISDLHIPFQHKKILDKTFSLIKDISPNIVILGGDIIDFYLVSFWLVDKTKITITQEILQTFNILTHIRELLPKAEIIYLEGNHEERFIKFILKKADVLAPLLQNKFSIPEILSLHKLNIEYRNKPFFLGKLLVLHGHEIKTSSMLVHVALTLLRKLGRPFIAGHFHTFQHIQIKEIDKAQKMGFVNPCIFDVELMSTPYQKLENNIFGFSIINFFNDYFYIDPVLFVQIKKNKFLTKLGKNALIF